MGQLPKFWHVLAIYTLYNYTAYKAYKYIIVYLSVIAFQPFHHSLMLSSVPLQPERLHHPAHPHHPHCILHTSRGHQDRFPHIHPVHPGLWSLDSCPPCRIFDQTSRHLPQGDRQAPLHLSIYCCFLIQLTNKLFQTAQEFSSNI